MKKRIFYTGLLVLLTLSSFAINPVSPEKTHAQKIVDAIHNPKSNYVVVVSHRGGGTIPRTQFPPSNPLSVWESM